VLVAELGEGDVLAYAGVGADLGAGAADVVHLPVQDVVGEAVLGDAVADHAAGLLVGLVDDGAVALLPQEPRGGEAGGAGAHYAHGLAPVRLSFGVFVVDAGEVGEVALHPVDAHRGLYVLAAALQLALADADPAADCGERVGLADQVHGLSVLAHGGQGQVALGVHAGGAPLHAGGGAVGVVVGAQQLQCRLAGGQHPVAAGVHHHVRSHPGGAGGKQVGPALHLHHADEAGAVGLQLLGVAEGGDGVQLLVVDYLQYGLAGVGLYLLVVYGQLYLLAHSSPPTSCRRRRSCSWLCTCCI